MTLTLKLRSEGKQERLHKVLATSGLGSRRKLEERILQGEVRLNGQPAELGSVVVPGDRVELEGKSFVIRSARGRLGQVLMYHKPEGELTSRFDPEGRPTVFESLPFLKGSRWIAVGRLDFNTTGLLLFTTDGELANKLMHPSTELEREYVARVYLEDPERAAALVERLREPAQLEDGPAQFDSVELIGASGHNALYKVTLKEGRNREVRRIFAAHGLEVGRLKRTRYGAVELPQRLARGNYETLSPEHALELARSVGHDAEGHQLVAEPEALARKRERESGKRVITPLRKPAGARSSDEFDRPRELVDRPDAGRARKPARGGQRRPGGKPLRGPARRPHAAAAGQGAAGPAPRGNATPGQRPARAAGQPRPARDGARPRPAQAQVPGRGPRTRRAAEFKGPMDYADAAHVHERRHDEADDNRGNRMDASAGASGGTAYTPGQDTEWRPNWQPGQANGAEGGNAQGFVQGNAQGNRGAGAGPGGQGPGARGPGQGPRPGGKRRAGAAGRPGGQAPNSQRPGPKPPGKRRKPRPRRERPGPAGQ